MYLPFMRAKQNELLAIRDAAPAISASRRMLPVLEPINADVEGTLRGIQRIVDDGVSVGVVLNPMIGELADDPHAVARALARNPLAGSNRVLPAYIVGRATRPADVASFLAAYPGQRLIFVHAGQYAQPGALLNPQVAYHVFYTDRLPATYAPAFPAPSRVALRDCFVREERNADYQDEDFFTDRHRTFARDGFAGFGDFLTIGDVLPGGGPPRAVAIHLTYAPNRDMVNVRHFVSDRTQSIADTPGKFLEALAKLVAFARMHAMPYSTAVPEFQDYHRRQHFPGLGTVKRLSMRHHLQLMATLV